MQNQDLLQWVNSKVSGHPVKNFKTEYVLALLRLIFLLHYLLTTITSWKDGKVLCALANAVKPGLLDLAASEKVIKFINYKFAPRG